MRAKVPWRDVRLGIRKDEFRRIGRRRFGVTSDDALAACLGMYPANLSRLLNGQVQASGPIVAAVITALDVPFEAVFEIRQPEPAQTVQAA